MVERKVLRLSPSVAGEVLTLQRAAYVSEAILYQTTSLAPLSQTLEQLEEELANERVIALGVRAGDRLIGAVRLRIEGDRAHLGRLVVAPDVQGSGVGTELLMAVDRFLPSQVRTVELFTGDKSMANIRLYERMGYVETRREGAGDFDLVFLERPVAGQLAR